MPFATAGAALASDAELGVAKVSYHAALVAAPAYVLQPTALLAIAVLTVLTVASSFGALTGSIMEALGAPLACRRHHRDDVQRWPMADPVG